MISAFEIYAILQLDNIRTVFAVFWFISFLGGLGSILSLTMDVELDDREEKIVKNFLAWSIIIFATSGLMIAFLPSTKIAATMMIIPKIAQNHQIQELPQKFIDLMLTELNEKTGK